MRILAFVALVGLAACQPEPPKPVIPGTLDSAGEVVLTVNGTTKVTKGMVDAVTKDIPPAQLEQLKTMGQYDELLKRMAVGQVLYEKAIADKLHESADVKLSLAMKAREVLAAEFIRKVGDDAVNDEAIKKLYEERAVRYKRPQAHARHILLKEQAPADELLEQLNKGADFEKVAAEHSIDPGSKTKGGDLGWFEEGRLIKEVSDAAFQSELNKVVGPIETRFGFHLLQVLERREATPLEEVRDQLEADLKKQAVEAYIKELETGLKIDKAEGGVPAGDAKPADAKPADAKPADKHEGGH